jgi:hypothetical protein
MFSPISVATTIALLIIELSTPMSACWHASLMISSSTKSNVVICASVRLPVRRNSTSTKRYTNVGRMTDSIVTTPRLRSGIREAARCRAARRRRSLSWRYDAIAAAG